MVGVETLLRVCDNSGASIVKCLRLPIGSRKCGKIGDFLLVTVRKKKLTATKSKIKRKKIYFGCLVRQRKQIKRFDGSLIWFDSNDVVLINVVHSWSRTEWNLVGSRISGPLPHEFRLKKFSKLLSLAPKIL